MTWWVDEVTKVAPGAIGALFSTRWIRGTTTEKLVMLGAGTALSYFGTADVSHWSGLNVGFTGFLLGLFGMAIAAKMNETWEHFELGIILKEAVRKLVGLPPTE